MSLTDSLQNELRRQGFNRGADAPPPGMDAKAQSLRKLLPVDKRAAFDANYKAAKAAAPVSCGTLSSAMFAAVRASLASPSAACATPNAAPPRPPTAALPKPPKPPLPKPPKPSSASGGADELDAASVAVFTAATGRAPRNRAEFESALVAGHERLRAETCQRPSESREIAQNRIKRLSTIAAVAPTVFAAIQSALPPAGLVALASVKHDFPTV